MQIISFITRKLSNINMYTIHYSFSGSGGGGGGGVRGVGGGKRIIALWFDTNQRANLQ